MLMADGDDIINSADDAATAAVDDRAEFIDGIILWCDKLRRARAAALIVTSTLEVPHS